jgi:crotonobetaine/carnitine-CoA ligase
MNVLEFSESRERLLGRSLLRQAEKLPDADFLLWEGGRASFGEVNRRANASARAFAELGVARGETVAFLMDGGPDWVWTALGLNKLGAIWVPNNTDYKGRWLEESLVDSHARTLVADGRLLPRLAELGPLPFERVIVRGDAGGVDLGIPAIPFEQLLQAPADEPDDADLDYGDTAAVLWTSGTTGRAKGVMQSHNVWIRAAIDGIDSAALQPGDVLYNCLPMYQSAAWVANVFQALVAGLPCAMDPHFSAGEFWNRLRHYGATVSFTLGAMHMFLWNAPERADDRDNPLRSAGMIPMPEDLVPAFRERFAIERIYQGYGQSEVMGLLKRRPDKRYQPNSLGEASTGLEVTLLDDRDLEVGIGDVGEFCVRPTEPYMIFSGYFHNPEATLEAYRNLWYHTGDLGRRGEDGDYFFVDRKADFIRFGGRNISSFAVEATVGAHPDVLQCAAHGVAAAELASEAELKVCVVRKPGSALDAEALARFVNDNAPHFFVPRYIEFLPELPQTPTGRVQKFKLRERGVTPETWDARVAGFVVER